MGYFPNSAISAARAAEMAREGKGIMRVIGEHVTRIGAHERAEFRLEIGADGGSITLPEGGGTHDFDILTIDLTGDQPRIGILRRKEQAPPVVA